MSRLEEGALYGEVTNDVMGNGHMGPPPPRGRAVTTENNTFQQLRRRMVVTHELKIKFLLKLNWQDSEIKVCSLISTYFLTKCWFSI